MAIATLTSHAQPKAVTAGAESFIQLRKEIQRISHESSHRLAGEDYDYVAMVKALEPCIQANALHEDALHRQGFLRALADLISTEVSGCGLPDQWDPVNTTAESFVRDQGQS